MRPIKFRGRNIKTGEIHYGHYSEYPVGGGRIETCIIDKNMDGWEVEPESVAQLIGYDADDNEVYDDDVLVDEDGVEWQINTIPQLEMLIGGVPDYLYNPKHKFKLKK